MMRLHVHVAVEDIERSARFYTIVFGAAPTVRKPDYAKWMLDDPRVNFAISARGGAVGIDHLGIQAETGDELDAVYARLRRAGPPVLEEGATVCCYAASEKAWIVDPQGVAWEAFLTSGESTVYGDGADLGPIRIAGGAAPGADSCGGAEAGRCGGGAMSGPPFHVLFLCTGNSARSILAEALLNHWGQGRFKGFSAGSVPRGSIHPCALGLLRSLDFPTEALRSKSWDEYASGDAPMMDFVFTVCDQAAAETCPIWPGRPITAHWGLADPATVVGSDIDIWHAFRDTFRQLESRIKLFVALPTASLDAVSLQRRVEAIGRMRSDAGDERAS